jgi:phospholipase C
MRRTLTLLSLVALLAGGVLAGSPSARSAPLQVAIAASPNPATSGDQVTIKGLVAGAGAGVRVVLWRRLPDEHQFHFSIGTRTGEHGVYEFALRPGVMHSNRWWYVTALGRRSRTVYERVQAAITLTASDSIPATGEAVTFSGHVEPSYAGQRLELDQNTGSGWQLLARPRLDSSSNYSTTRTFGSDELVQVRAFLRGGKRNIDSRSAALPLSVAAIHHIKHVVIIMQENRSFDHYFGTYPGVLGGINPASPPCVPDPAHPTMPVCAFHTTADKNYGGPHGQTDAIADLDCTDFASRTGCKMDGFVGQAEKASNCTTNPNDPQCSPCRGGTTGACNDAMSYHDGSDIPNYWAYARNYVLQDQMFEPNASWSLPQHLFMVSEWSASCTNPLDAFSCTNALQNPNSSNGSLHYAWTDLTYLLHRAGISWGYYVFKGTEPDCQSDSSMTCTPVQQGPQTPGIWNPLPSFTDVAQDGQLGDVQTLSNFFAAAKSGTLPAVSWIDPNGTVSEHPTALVSKGQTYVTGLVNALMQGPNWNSTAIFLSWDDWGGFYDSLVPPSVDANGYGIRVPGIVISPYAKQGFIDHQILSHDAYNKFIEDDFLGGQRLDPRTDGRPDPRPGVREANLLGDLVNDFAFNQSPRAPVVLPVCPQTDLTPAPTC